ncbi:FAD dependent oxidoreductase superfamily protein [Sarocladium strictum]
MRRLVFLCNRLLSHQRTMGGGEAMPGFPHPNPIVSYWQLPPHRLAQYRSTEELPTAQTWDYVIIGSGITGAAVTYKLLTRNPTLRIIMLEARTAASAASGRNGGHVRAGWHLNFSRNADAFGDEVALAFERFETDNVADITDFVRDNAVDCDFRDVETADVYTDPAAWAAALETMRRRKEAMRRRSTDDKSIQHGLAERHVLEGEAARARIGLPSAVGAITYTAHTQNPYKLVCHMLELGLRMGMNLQTNTMALQVLPPKACLEGCEVNSETWTVVTDRGNLTYRRVVLATNAYTNALHPQLRQTGFLVPARSQVSAIRPGSNIENHPVMKDTSVALNDIGLGDYFMVRDVNLPGAGDILYGGGRIIHKSLNTVDDSVVNEDVAAYLNHAGFKVFGKGAWGHEGSSVRDWGGITCYTPDSFPIVGEDTFSYDQKGLWMAIGMNGHGMGLAFRCAEALVEMMMTGTTPEWLPEPFNLNRVWTQRVRNRETMHRNIYG